MKPTLRQYNITWVHPTHHPKRLFNRSSRFCAADAPYTLHCGTPFLKNLSLPEGIWTPSDTRFLGSSMHSANHRNGSSIESAVFPEFTVVTHGQTERPT